MLGINHLRCEAFYRLKITPTEIDINSKRWIQKNWNLQGYFFHRIWPAPSSHQKDTVLLGYRSLEEEAPSWKHLVAMTDFSFPTKQIRSKLLVFDTNNVLLFIVRQENSPLGTWFPCTFGTNKYNQPSVKSWPPENLKARVLVRHKMKKLTKCRNGVLSLCSVNKSEYFRHSTNQGWVILPSFTCN